MTENRVIIMAGGTGISIDVMNTIENKISKHYIISALEREDNQKLIAELEEKETDFYSVWGYSDKDTNLRNNPLKEGDVVFITHRHTAIYVGKVFKSFRSEKLNSIWLGQKAWPNKILLTEVFKIFIPDPLNNSLNRNRKELENICIDNPFAPDLNKLTMIKKLYNDNIGFRDIINKTTKRGNFQGSIYADIDIEQVFYNLAMYSLKCNYECILKEV